MQAEVSTRFKLNERLRCGVFIFDIKLTPRGSGNRAAARRLAQQFRTHEKMKPHIVKVVCGTSRVTVHFINSLELMNLFRELRAEELERRADRSQLKLFGGLELA